jgi:hypothetical protein
MLSFIKYVLMIEAKVDDLVAKHPEHAEAIRAYHAADPTPTKKFLPWLTKQHIAGNVTPNDVRLGSTLQHFDKVKHQLDKKDHSSYHYNDLANTVGDRVKAKLEADAKKNSVETIHKEPSGITAQHIKTKEASQDLYGGGAERGGKKGCARGTSWCVSARGRDNAFGGYGHMYTVHDPNDEHAPYAVHPFHDGGTITSRHNDGDNPHKEVVANNPKIAKAVNAVMAHSAKHIDKHLNDENAGVRREAFKHPNVTNAHIDRGVNDEDSNVRYAAIEHPNAKPEHITKAMNDEHTYVRVAAIKHPNVTPEHITKAMNDKEEYVRYNAMLHPNATPKHITKAMNDENFMVRVAAIQHPNATPEHVIKAVNDEHESVRHEALKKANNLLVKNPHLRPMMKTAADRYFGLT